VKDSYKKKAAVPKPIAGRRNGTNFYIDNKDKITKFD